MMYNLVVFKFIDSINKFLFVSLSRFFIYCRGVHAKIVEVRSVRRLVFGCGKKLARADARAIFGRELARDAPRYLWGCGVRGDMFWSWQGISTSGCSRYLWVRMFALSLAGN